MTPRIARIGMISAAGTRSCRNERVVRSHKYEPISILTHGSLDLIDDRRTAFSVVLVGNQIDYLPAGSRRADAAVERRSACYARHQPLVDLDA
jgi:hypothetical protein